MSRKATKGSFVKGDPRCHRDGRPKNSGDLTALAKRIGHEVATKKNGGELEPVLGPDGKQRGFIRAPFNNQKLIVQLPGLVKRD